MPIDYLPIEAIIAHRGLRLVLVQGVPSPWGQAAKAMAEHKGLEFVCGAQVPGAANEALVAWAGTNSGPVVAWAEEAPRNRWDDILFLFERLGPQRPLIPEDRALRVQVLGLCHEICGELGLGWNARLAMFRPALESGRAPEGVKAMGAKYGYREADVARAEERLRASLAMFAGQLAAQRQRGRHYLVGEDVSAVDFYWAAFCNLLDMPGDDLVPLPAQARQMFLQIPEAVRGALDPELKAHRDHMLERFFRIPMEM